MINPKNLCPGCMNEKLTEGKCHICGYGADEPVNPQYLMPGSVLDGRYVVGKVIEINGEGVTYIGFDTVTSATVNIREFFPAGLCERDLADSASVIMLSGSEYNYNDSLNKFIELSKALFRLNELPALFDVLDVREANSTAYRITKSVPGISLREFLMRNGGMLKWDQARSLFAPLVASVSALHKAGIIHRGISPDTLIVGKDGKLRISGFCIAEARTAKSPLTSQLFPGFAAVEQYGDMGRQGPRTDIYAFAATIYRTLVGNPPPEATSRLENDNMTIPAQIAREIPKTVLETLANALQVLPDDRTQNIDEMRKGLSVSSVQVSNLGTSSRSEAAERSVDNRSDLSSGRASKKKKKKNHTGKMYFLVALIVAVFLLGGVLAVIITTTDIFESEASNQNSDNGLTSSFDVPSTTPSTEVEFNEDYSVLPKFQGLDFADVCYDRDFVDVYKFKISHKEYSDTIPEGHIISQSPAVGTTVEAGTTVEFVVSLGSYYVNMIDVTGFDRDSALLELLKAGFSYDNIKFTSKYDDTKDPGVVISTDPERGLSVNRDCNIEVYINSYQGEPADEPTGEQEEQ